MNLDRIQFTIQEDRSRGVCELTYNRYTDDDHQEGLTTKMALLSVWIDPVTQNAAKAYIVPSPQNRMHMRLVEDIRSLRYIQGKGNMCLTTDGRKIRYGCMPGGAYTSTNQDTHEPDTFFDSAGLTIEKILEGINNHQTLGGLNLVSFSRLPETILIESGFEKIEDAMKLERFRPGISMWKGRIERIAPYYIGYGSRKEENLKAQRQFLDSLAKIIDKTEAVA